MSRTEAIRVYARQGKWLVNYGSYAHGYHATREEAIEVAIAAARFEGRELTIEADRGGEGS